MKLPEIPLSKLLSFIEEDAPYGDITTAYVLDPISCNAVILTREDTVIAGGEEFSRICNYYGITIKDQIPDGKSITAGGVIATLSGDVRDILLIERTVLNLMGRMCGIATTCRRIQTKISTINPKCKIAVTRKTAPGLRLIDKKAAAIGGADPHRFGLSDAFLIKDTHRNLISVGEAVRRARAADTYHRIEVEVESLEDAISAIKGGADIIMFDNMTPVKIKDCLNALSEKDLRGRVVIEVSGGVTEKNIDEYAVLDINRISMGALTHSVKNIDLSLEVTD